MKLTWYGHSCFLLTTDQTTILIDPFFSGNPTSPIGPEQVAAEVILISHGHGDHVGDTVAIAKRCGSTVVANFEICNWLIQQGVKNTHAQHIGGGFNYPWGRVQLTMALHGSAMPDGSYGGNPCGLLLRVDGQVIYHAGDTGLFSDMKLIGEAGLDLAILPIGDNFTMGPDEALRAVEFLHPRRAIPIHYNTFPLIEQSPQAWASRVEAVSATQVIVMTPGQTISL